MKVLLLESAEEENAVTSFTKGTAGTKGQSLLKAPDFYWGAPKSHVYIFSYCLITAVVHNIYSSCSLLYTAKILKWHRVFKRNKVL